MANILKQLLGLVILGCLFIVLVQIGIAVFLVALAIAAIAAIWFTIRVIVLRKDIKSTLHEYNSMKYSDAFRNDSGERMDVIDGEVIEAEYVEIDEKTPKKASKSDEI